MIKLLDGGYYLEDGRAVPAGEYESGGAFASNGLSKEEFRAEASRKTMARSVLEAHDISKNGDALNLKFDCLASHDITYVGIIQTIRASAKDYERFPVPYALSNCHNSLCAVGGTINADDHAFGLSAAKKFGGIFIPPHFAVIHQYMREAFAACGKMILGSDSHTRYGPLGTLGFGEGGGELVKQLLGKTYDIPVPEIVGVRVEGETIPGVGPQDVALALIAAVFESGFVKNKILEFFGGGIKNLSMDFRNGIDVMTTETACLSSVWVTDEKTEEYLAVHGRAGGYEPMHPGDGAYYDGLIEIDLSKIKPMIALPYHPSNAVAIEEFADNAEGLIDASLRGKLSGGKLFFDQGIIGGCAGGLYENICEAAQIIGEGNASKFPFNIYPASQPVYLSLAENGVASRLLRAGAVIKTAFCGPCFGAGDIPPHNGISARHATRNFPNREGSKPNSGQSAAVALLDARSIAATAKNGGLLTAASEKDFTPDVPKYFFEKSIYDQNVYSGFGKPDAKINLVFGPGIRDWPPLQPLAEHLLLRVAAYITDPVTTTDELIPSGETSSYRSNPQALSEFTLSRKDPGYVARAREAAEPERARLEGKDPLEANEGLKIIFEKIKMLCYADPAQTGFGSLIYARKPGDGSAREQAASCQRVLGGVANVALEYATKRYRSNLVNWGLLPFITESEPEFEIGDYIFIPDIKTAIENKSEKIKAYIIKDESIEIVLLLPGLSDGEAEIILRGGLINYYSS